MEILLADFVFYLSQLYTIRL